MTAADDIRAQVIAIWRDLDPKPFLPAFAKMLEARGISVPLATIETWRKRGHLPGVMPRHTPPSRTKAELDAIRPAKSVEKVVRKVAKEAGESAVAAARLDVDYGREDLKRMAGAAVAMAEAFIRKLTTAVDKVEITTPAGVAAVSGAAATIIDKVGALTDALRLIEQADAAQETRGTAEIHDFERALEEAAKKRGLG